MKYQENLKTSWNYCLALSTPPKMKISPAREISQKISHVDCITDNFQLIWQKLKKNTFFT